MVVAVRKSEWQKDTSAQVCTLCQKRFSAFTRRHHCRLCAKLFCKHCSSSRLHLKRSESDQGGRKMRVCQTCAECAASVFPSGAQTESSTAWTQNLETPVTPHCNDGQCALPVPGKLPSVHEDAHTLASDKNTKGPLESLAGHCDAFSMAISMDRIMDAAACAEQILAERSALRELGENVDGMWQGIDLATPDNPTCEGLCEEKRRVEVVLQEFISEEGWTRTSDHGGVKTWFRKRQDSPSIDSKLEVLFPVPAQYSRDPSEFFARQIALLHETDLMPEWFAPKGLLRRVALIVKPRLFQSLVRAQLEFPWYAPLSNREMMLLATGYDISQPGLEATVITYRSVSATVPEDRALLPDVDLSPTPGYVEVSATGAYYTELVTHEGSVTGLLFRTIQSADLKIAAMPPAIVNFAAKSKIPRELVANVKEIVNNFSGTEWDKRVREDQHGVYREILKRMRDKLQESSPSRHASADVAVARLSALHDDMLSGQVVEPIATISDGTDYNVAINDDSACDAIENRSSAVHRRNLIMQVCPSASSGSPRDYSQQEWRWVLVAIQSKARLWKSVLIFSIIVFVYLRARARHAISRNILKALRIISPLERGRVSFGE